MRRSALILAAGLAGLVGAPATAAAALPIDSGSPTPVRVTPRVGGPRTRFRFSLKLPSATRSGGLRGTYDTLSAAGPHRAGCVGAASAVVPAGAAGTRVSVRLDPVRFGGRWCTGRFDGYVLETLRVVCSSPPVDACPMIVVAPRIIARFWFRVR